MRRAIVIGQWGWLPKLGGTPHFSAEVLCGDAVGRPMSPKPYGRYRIRPERFFDADGLTPAEGFAAAIGWAEREAKRVGAKVWYEPATFIASRLPSGGADAERLASVNRGFRYAESMV